MLGNYFLDWAYDKQGQLQLKMIVDIEDFLGAIPPKDNVTICVRSLDSLSTDINLFQIFVCYV